MMKNVVEWSLEHSLVDRRVSEPNFFLVYSNVK